MSGQKRAAAVLVLPLLLAAAVAGHGQQTDTLLLSGQPVPDGNGTVLLVGHPTLNDQGQVAVVLWIDGSQSPSTDARGVYRVARDSIVKLVRAGEPAPDGNGVFDDLGEEVVAINDDGRVAFRAALSGTNAPPTDLLGVFGADSMGVIQYVRLGDSAPDGNGTFGDPGFAGGLSVPGLDDLGRVSFHGTLIGTSGGAGVDDRGIFRAGNGSIVRLLRLGQQEPSGSGTIVCLQDANCDEALPPASSAVGEVAMQAEVDAAGPPSSDMMRIYVANQGGSVAEAFRSGAPTPSADGEIASMERTRIAEDGDLAFQGGIGGIVFGVVPALFWTDGATLAELARIGQEAPFETASPAFTYDSFPGFDVSSRGEVVFSAVLSRSAVPPDNRTSAIYRWQGGALQRLVRQGDPAPDGNGVFGELGRAVQLSEDGLVVFTASLDGTASPPSDDFGLFQVDSLGTVEQIARKGQPMEGSTITVIQFLTDRVDDTDLPLAGMNAINNRGQVAYSARLADLRYGLFLYSPSLFADGFESGDSSRWSATVP